MTDKEKIKLYEEILCRVEKDYRGMHRETQNVLNNPEEYGGVNSFTYKITTRLSVEFMASAD